MENLIKNYKLLEKDTIDFLLYTILAAVIEDSKFAYIILQTKPNILKVLKKQDWVVVINETVSATSKTFDLFESTGDDVSIVLKQFNLLKAKHRGINRNSVITASTKSLITARLKSNSLETILGVIEMKFIQWSGSSMEKYLRFETILNATKFESYADEYETFKKEHNTSKFNFE